MQFQSHEEKFRLSKWGLVSRDRRVSNGCIIAEIIRLLREDGIWSSNCNSRGKFRKIKCFIVENVSCGFNALNYIKRFLQTEFYFR